MNDYYVHQSQDGYRAWRCMAVEPKVTWEHIPVLTSELGEDGEQRKFIITSTGLPGWVRDETVTRKYKDMKGKDKPRDGSKGKQKDVAKETQPDQETKKAREKGKPKSKGKSGKA